MVKESFDINFIANGFPKILGALPITLEITAITLVIGWLLGLVLAIGKIKGKPWLQFILRISTDIIRGIPTVVLLYIVYFGLPILLNSLFGINMRNVSKITFVVIALSIELATSGSEMFRSAYNSLQKGQLEAAHALGYTTFQRFIHVILPQGTFVILPNLGNAVLSVIQATALVYTLGIFDILGKARQLDLNVSGVKTFEMYTAVAIIYWFLALIVGELFKLLEKHFGRGSKNITGVSGNSKNAKKVVSK